LLGSLLFGAILARYLSKPIHLMRSVPVGGQGRDGCQSGWQDGWAA
jgi:hypothetical protein